MKTVLPSLQNPSRPSKMTVSSRREQTPVSTERDLNENVKEFRNSDKFDNNSSDTDYSDSDSKMSADEREARLQPDPSASSSSSGDEAEAPIVDPFTHRLGLGPVDWIKTIWCTFFLMPIRIFFLFLSVIGAYVCSFFALRGLSDEQKSRYPLTGYRKVFRSASSFFGRVAFRVTGFLSVNVKGVQASAEEAPILVVAPHSTFFDGFAAFFSGLPYIVSRKENKAIPFIGKCIECAQALCVSREDPKSRQKTVQEIIRRIGSGDPWPQLMIFPEGSCSNRQALMSFKPGAFYPGKAVQPVLIRYPNK